MMLLRNALRGLLYSVLYHSDQWLKISVCIICMTFFREEWEPSGQNRVEDKAKTGAEDQKVSGGTIHVIWLKL